MTNVLVACEFTGEIRRRLRNIGINAISCDLLPAEDGEKTHHYQGDVMDILYDGWDAMIAHPVCKYLTNSGVRWLYNNDKTFNLDRWEKMRDGANFFKTLWDAPIKKKAIENPIPHRYALDIIGEKYTQIIQPYQFGHMEQKATCLWLYGFPPLEETDNVYEKMMLLPKSKRQRIHYLSPSDDRDKERSKTFPGIAEAIVKQWFLNKKGE